MLVGCFILALFPLLCRCVCTYVSSINASSSVQLEVAGVCPTVCAQTNVHTRTFTGAQNGFHPMLAIDAHVQGVHRFVDCSVLMQWRVPYTVYIDVDRYGH